MAQLVPGSPWSEVVHIGENTGAHGGRFWVLTLACGHIATRSNPVPKNLTEMFGRRGLRFAPKRVRCYVCGCQIPRAGGVP